MTKNQHIADTSNDPKDFYEEHLEKIQLLTPEEEQALGLRIRQGDIQARNNLVESNLRFVMKCAKEFSTYDVPRWELISAGNAALIATADRFDPAYETHFISYAVRSIRQSMFNAINEYTQTVRVPTNRLKEVKFRYESFDASNAPNADDDNKHLSPQNRLQAEPTTSQNELTYDEISETLRHLLSKHFTSMEVDFIMDYAEMKVRGYKPRDIKVLAERYHIPTRLAKNRLNSLLQKVNDLHLYAAYINQAA